MHLDALARSILNIIALHFSFLFFIIIIFKSSAYHCFFTIRHVSCCSTLFGLKFSLVFRDPRLNDEARAHLALILEKFPPSSAFSLASMRTRGEGMHGTVNEKLIGTFKGVEQEQTVKIDDQTGIFLLLRSEWSMIILSRHTCDNLYTS